MNNDGTYEFDHAQNQQIGRTGLWARTLGIVLIAQGAVGLLDITTNAIGSIIGLAIALAIGLAFFKGGGALQRVVDTEGLDMPHMLESLSEVTRAFTIRIVLVLIGLGFVLLALLFVLLVAAA
jgi:hypothetical protein